MSRAALQPFALIARRRHDWFRAMLCKDQANGSRQVGAGPLKLVSEPRDAASRRGLAQRCLPVNPARRSTARTAAAPAFGTRKVLRRTIAVPGCIEMCPVQKAGPAIAIAREAPRGAAYRRARRDWHSLCI